MASFFSHQLHSSCTIAEKELCMVAPTPFSIVALVALSLFASIAFPADKPTTRPALQDPDPALAPEQVVRAVLDALKQNNADDDGIRTTFKFASAANQAV